MFELLFKYPASLFAKGQFVFLAAWPLWALGVCTLLAAATLAYPLWKTRRQHEEALSGMRSTGIWILQTLLVTVLLFILWHPALSVATLRPRQNIVAVVVDDSKSMAFQETGGTRRDQVVQALNSGVLKSLEKKFQVRLYRAGAALERIVRIRVTNN